MYKIDPYISTYREALDYILNYDHAKLIVYHGSHFRLVLKGGSLGHPISITLSYAQSSGKNFGRHYTKDNYRTKYGLKEDEFCNLLDNFKDVAITKGLKLKAYTEYRPHNFVEDMLKYGLFFMLTADILSVKDFMSSDCENHPYIFRNWAEYDVKEEVATHIYNTLECAYCSKEYGSIILLKPIPRTQVKFNPLRTNIFIPLEYAKFKVNGKEHYAVFDKGSDFFVTGDKQYAVMEELFAHLYQKYKDNLYSEKEEKEINMPYLMEIFDERVWCECGDTLFQQTDRRGKNNPKLCEVCDSLEQSDKDNDKV